MLELGLEDRVQVVELPARMPSVAKPDLDTLNPLGKVPALITDEGELVADSPVIVAYLDALAGDRLIPSGPERWRTLTLAALADGCMDAGVVIRVEHLKDEARRDQGDIAAYAAKIERTFDLLEYRADRLPSQFDAGALSLICAAEWLVFREILPDPLATRPRLGAWAERFRDRPSLAATRPRA